MKRRGWHDYLPERSQLVILAGAAIVLFASLAFINLANAKSAALQERRAVQGQLAALQDQNERLRTALQQAQRGDNIEPRARQYFNMVRKGEKQLLVQGVPEPSSVAVGAFQGPYWAEWWEVLTSP